MYDLLFNAFIPEERRSKEAHMALLDHPHYALYVRRDEGVLTGFLSTFELDEFRFVEHFAVGPHMRSKGIGGTLLREYCELDARPVILEVEPPDTAPMASRRIAFYEKHGFFLNHYAYLQPPLQLGFSPLPLLLMSRPQTLSEEQFCSIRQVLYQSVYNIC